MRSPRSDASSFGAAPNHRATHATPPDRNERPRPQASAGGHWRSRPDPSGSCGPRERTNTCLSAHCRERLADHRAVSVQARSAGTAVVLRVEDPMAGLRHVISDIKTFAVLRACVPGLSEPHAVPFAHTLVRCRSAGPSTWHALTFSRCRPDCWSFGA